MLCELFDKEWFQSMGDKEKLLFIFVCLKADNAGIYEHNGRYASFILNNPTSKEDILNINAYKTHFELLPNGKIFMPGFVQFQCKKLSRNCKAHNPIFETLEKYGLLDRVLETYNTPIEENQNTTPIFDDKLIKILEKHNIKNEVINEYQKPIDNLPKDIEPLENTNYSTPEDDFKFANDAIAIYNKIFKKNYFVSNKTRQRIQDLSKKEKISLSKWEIIFKNAFRGWNFKSGNVKPPLSTIIEEWEKFLNDDYCLAKAEGQSANIDDESEKKAAKKIVADLDFKLLAYSDAYRGANNVLKAQAQELYNKNLPKGEKTALKFVDNYCKAERGIVE